MKSYQEARDSYCPYCKAQPSKPCINQKTGKPMRIHHTSRYIGR